MYRDTCEQLVPLTKEQYKDHVCRQNLTDKMSAKGYFASIVTATKTDSLATNFGSDEGWFMRFQKREFYDAAAMVCKPELPQKEYTAWLADEVQVMEQYGFAFDKEESHSLRFKKMH